jgi:hypothetical protein
VDVLVVGSGAREHALLRALRRDPAVGRLVCAPGNAGTARESEARPLDVGDAAAVAALAAAEGVDLVVVGPEVPLVAGAADAVRAAGIACFGPSAAAAVLEGSKAFAKDVMAAAGYPPRQRTCSTTPTAAPRTWPPPRPRTSSRPTDWPPARACTSAATSPSPPPSPATSCRTTARAPSSRTTSTAPRCRCSR